MDNLLYSVEKIRMVERSAAMVLGDDVLMRRAGAAATRFALALLGDHRKLPVLLVAGPGNNGGDALETAAGLREAGVETLVLHLPGSGAASLETTQALQRAQASGAQFIDALPEHLQLGLVVDGMFGIGLARPLQGRHAEIARLLHDYGCPVLALDVPSGLDADTGTVIGSGPDRVAVTATHTITFIGNKPGLHTCDGRDHAGCVRVDDLGIASHEFPAPSACLNGPALFGAELKAARRPQNSHKGSFGDIAILGGAQGMAGAPVLAARAALLSGAGRVFVAALDPALCHDSMHPELMFRVAGSFDFSGRTVVAGPGMGEAPTAARLLAKLIGSDSPLVIDADALNRVSGDTALQAQLAQRKAPAILTPHPLEAARLLGVTAAVVQADRIEAAREISGRFNATVVLKGSGTIIAENKSHTMVINPTGNPGLATGGTGDVLSGVCGALLAQGWGPLGAALGAVWMHGTAADELVDSGVGPIGMAAGELAPAIRSILNRLVRQAAGN
ncbi:bifunctional ADP-dependent NAD(P)H-hydrate dehydratase/NAD(P)H-hydrate epimerase [Massilia terrae]